MKIRLADLIPYEDITLHSDLSADEVRNRIASSINPGKALRERILQARQQEKPFDGVQTGDSFSLHGFLGRNSFFSPVTEVTALPLPAGSIARLKMRLSHWVSVMMALWLGFSGLASLINLYAALSSEGTMFSKLVGISFPAILFLWGYLVCIVGFKLDSRRIRAFFEALLRR